MRARSPGFLGPEFNDFLFAPIGAERNGGYLSVVSALARLDLDPWAEAAKLAKLPVEVATQKLSILLQEVPLARQESWENSGSFGCAFATWSERKDMLQRVLLRRRSNDKSSIHPLHIFVGLLSDASRSGSDAFHSTPGSTYCFQRTNFQWLCEGTCPTSLKAVCLTNAIIICSAIKAAKNVPKLDRGTAVTSRHHKTGQALAGSMLLPS